MAKESWQVQPSVFEAEDPSVHTPFEDAWDALQPMLSGSSWYKAEEAGSIWEYLQRIDVLSGIGHFGGLLMGFDDGKNLQEPVDGAMVTNVFCPTGEGGGVDPSCGSGGKPLRYSEFMSQGHTEKEWDQYRDQQRNLGFERAHQRTIADWHSGKEMPGSSLAQTMLEKGFKLDDPQQWQDLQHDDTVVSKTSVEGRMNRQRAKKLHAEISKKMNGILPTQNQRRPTPDRYLTKNEGAMTTNAFCPTGEGGGQDNSCGGREKNSAGISLPKVTRPMNEDEIDWVKRHKVEMTSDGKMILYHGTISARAIRKSGVFNPGSYFTDDSKHAAYEGGRFGKKGRVEVLKVAVRPEDIWVGIHVTMRENKPLPLEELKPVSNRYLIPDCYLTRNEEDNLRRLPNLTEQEEFTLNCLAKQREMIVNTMQARQNIRERPQQNPVFGQTTDEHDPKSMTGVSGTDKQYSQEFGLQGEADYSPGLSGTDQQYFGVQFGPTELPSKQPSKRKLNLLFLRPFDESLVQIVRYEWNINNPRFGMPVMYRITLNDPREQHSGIGLPMATVFVHWSRVLHVNDVFANEGSSEIFSPPRCRAVLNRLLDLQKIYGASAEGYWQAAFTGISLETHPQLGGDVTIDNADVRGQLENYVNSLQRYLALTGMSAHTLAPEVSDPSNQIDKHLEAICIQLSIPKRVFMGSERGELASTQDDASWNDRLKARQQGYITPRIIVPFIDRLISVGVLPEPSYVEPVEGEADEFGEQYDEDGNLIGQGEEQYDEDGNQIGSTFEEQYDEDGNPVSEGSQYDDGARQDADQGTDTLSEMGDGGNAVEQDEESQEEDEEDRTPASLTKNRRSSIIRNAAGDQVGMKTAKGYSVAWPDLDSNTDLGKAQVAATKVQAMATYVSGNVESVMPLMDFYTKILGMTDEEAKDLVKSAEEMQAQQQMDQQQQQMMGGQFGDEQQPGQFSQDGMLGQEDQFQSSEEQDGESSFPPTE